MRADKEVVGVDGGCTKISGPCWVTFRQHKAVTVKLKLWFELFINTSSLELQVLVHFFNI